MLPPTYFLSKKFSFKLVLVNRSTFHMYSLFFRNNICNTLRSFFFIFDSFNVLNKSRHAGYCTYIRNSRQNKQEQQLTPKKNASYDIKYMELVS
jgi:hypothetical protein